MQDAQVSHQSDAMNDMFSPKKFQEIASKEPVATYLKDPSFKQKWDLMQLNPQAMLGQMMGGGDPRFMEVFGLLTGIDLQKMKQAS